MIQLNPHDIGAPQQAPRETNFTSPYVQGWLGKIREAERHKTGFNDVAKQCMSFFSGAMNFMWESDFFSKHIGVPYSPKFKICIQKGFELVSLLAPAFIGEIQSGRSSLGSSPLSIQSCLRVILKLRCFTNSFRRDLSKGKCQRTLFLNCLNTT